MKNNYFILLADCKLVDGPTRSIIYDMSRSSYSFIPNVLYEILSEDYALSINGIVNKYGLENEQFILEYFEFLLEKEYILLSDNPSERMWFPGISEDWESPYEITNVIIDYRDKVHPIKKIIDELESLGSVHIEFRFFSDVLLDELIVINEAVAEYRVNSISLLVPHSLKINVEQLVKENKRIKHVEIYGSEESSAGMIEQALVVRSEDMITSNKCCGAILKKNFNLNLAFFNESKNYNNCLNKKVSIDENGEIKNCPSFSDSFGNIEDKLLSDVIETETFRSVWAIDKSQIDTCQTCEFRYMCMDCRAYRETPEDVYSKPLKCGYDPNTGEWKEWSRNPLKKTAIEHFNLF